MHFAFCNFFLAAASGQEEAAPKRSIALAAQAGYADPSQRSPSSPPLRREEEEGKAPEEAAGPASFQIAGVDPNDDQPQGYMRRVPSRPYDLSGSDYFPIDDRWRLGFPLWDRYYYGRLANPYDLNVLKGDYPFLGKDVFFSLTVFNDAFFEDRRLPVKKGDIEQEFFRNNLLLTFDLFRGDNSFHPSEWFLRLTPAFNVTKVTGQDVASDFALQEGFADVQLAIVSEFYDAVNLRGGRQGFVSDFRGFLFADVNDAVRLFGNYDANRTQWNVITFKTVQKDKVSAFNTFDDREQEIVIANVIRQDFVFEGFNVEGALLYDHDHFKNQVDAGYLEIAGDGHIGRWNISAAFIQAFGRDDFNPIAKRDVTINAQFAALEIAYPLDWFIPKASVLFASGEKDPKGGKGRGFDAIFDNPFFAGDGFSYLNREAIQPGGVQLSNTFSFLPNLRTKANDPANFVNPGLALFNLGFDARLTTRLIAQVNLNYYDLIHPEPVEAKFLEVNKKAINVGREIGIEPGFGIVCKPLIVDNLVFTLGGSILFPGDAITDLNGGDHEPLFTLFTAITAIY